jgi:hypothetical protein
MKYTLLGAPVLGRQRHGLHGHALLRRTDAQARAGHAGPAAHRGRGDRLADAAARRAGGPAPRQVLPPRHRAGQHHHHRTRAAAAGLRRRAAGDRRPDALADRGAQARLRADRAVRRVARPEAGPLDRHLRAGQRALRGLHRRAARAFGRARGGRPPEAAGRRGRRALPAGVAGRHRHGDGRAAAAPPAVDGRVPRHAAGPDRGAADGQGAAPARSRRRRRRGSRRRRSRTTCRASAPASSAARPSWRRSSTCWRSRRWSRVLGMGGMGKTRITLQAATELMPRYPTASGSSTCRW